MGLSELGISITILSFTLFAFRTGNKLEKLAYGKKNTPFDKWSQRMEFSRWWVSCKRKKEKDGYYRLTGWVESYFPELDFMGNKIICSRYFDTAIYKDDQIFIKGVDIERINVIDNIIVLNRYIREARKNYPELTDLCLERHNEMFILLYSTDKYLIELSLESLRKVEELLIIAKEDVEKEIASKEHILKQFSKDESVLIEKKLDDELYISKQLKNRRNELISEMSFLK
jgi:hypothetical protein